MKKILVFIFTVISFSIYAHKLSINKNWKFILDDIEDVKNLTYNDSSWNKVNIPHDWAFENGFSKNGAQKDNGGYAMGGIGWYRKYINISSSQLENKKIFIDFDGVYMNSQVWVNGNYLGKRVYGYISFSYEITKYLKDGENLISVRVDNSKEPSARWYHGCGIYNDVFLRVTNKIHFPKDEIFISTPQINKNFANVNISSKISLDDDIDTLTLKTVILDSNNIELVSKNTPIVKKEKSATIDVSLKVNEPKLWSPETPNLYLANITIVDKYNNIIDSENIKFGIRKIDWDAQTGFYLNDKRYQIKGVCEHLEGGPTGAINTPQLWAWKIKLLKDMGVNAIRTGHTPFSPTFYDLCDKMGMLVLDEIFDGWKKKAEYDYGAQAFEESWKTDMYAWIMRDRNHPCVFLYSVGNETSGEIGQQLVAYAHKLDSTRLVTSGSADNKYMDIDGWNGGSENIEFVSNYKPTKPFLGTEHPHTWATRDYYRTQTWYRNGYPNDRHKPEKIPNLTPKEIFFYNWTNPENFTSQKQVFNPSYDNGTKGITARHSIEFARKYKWFSGSFRWTGFDYLGEAGFVHGGWPYRASITGALDLAGLPKDLYYLYQAEWTNIDMVHISPFWTHPTMVKGTLIPVRIYTSGDEVELFFNDKSLGKKQKSAKWDEMQLDWLVPWQEGTLKAIAYRNGKQIATAIEKSSSSPASIAVEKWENRDLKADETDIAILTTKTLDDNGNFYPYGENTIFVKTVGDIKVLSFENGNPIDVQTNYNASSRKSFFGLNRLFVQSTSCDDSKPASVLLGVISGDKKLMLSDKITITAQEIQLRGQLKNRDFKIYYTTDGTQPTKNSKQYLNPFSIKLPTVVNAIVCDNENVLLNLTEIFSENDGIYWGSENDSKPNEIGEQAEDAILENATIFNDGLDYAGRGYVHFDNIGSTITWYQENDSDTYKAMLKIRYAQQYGHFKHHYLNLYINDTLISKLKFADTLSNNKNWLEVKVPITISKGANYIKLESISDESPNVDQIIIEDM